MRLRPGGAPPRTRWGSSRRSPRPLVGWGGDTPPHTPPPSAPAAPRPSRLSATPNVFFLQIGHCCEQLHRHTLSKQRASLVNVRSSLVLSLLFPKKTPLPTRFHFRFLALVAVCQSAGVVIVRLYFARSNLGRDYLAPRSRRYTNRHYLYLYLYLTNHSTRSLPSDFTLLLTSIALQAVSGRECPLCRQRHLSNIFNIFFRLSIPNPNPEP